MNEPILNCKKCQGVFLLALKGFCMGIADVIPGVSGGTIAFLCGIYEEFIRAIRSFDIGFVKLFFSGNFKKAFAGVHWRFLAALLTGILSAIFTFARVISWLLLNYPVQVQAFFFGLVAATVPIIFRNLRHINRPICLVMLCASLVMYKLVGMVPIVTPETLWFLFLLECRVQSPFSCGCFGDRKIFGNSLCFFCEDAPGIP